MSDMIPRRSGAPSRRTREQRAYRLVLIGGAASVVAAVGFVLAIVGVLGFSVPVLAVIAAAVCALLFRRTVSG
jgi:ABC-type bacteriocin/lantibiotic exporter with double-glycine peptidase domain